MYFMLPDDEFYCRRECEQHCFPSWLVCFSEPCQAILVFAWLGCVGRLIKVWRPTWPTSVQNAVGFSELSAFWNAFRILAIMMLLVSSLMLSSGQSSTYEDLPLVFVNGQSVPLDWACERFAPSQQFSEVIPAHQNFRQGIAPTMVGGSHVGLASYQVAWPA